MIAFISSSNPSTVQLLEPGTSQTHPLWTFNPTPEQVSGGFGVVGMFWSPNGKYLALVTSTSQAEWVALSVLDVAKKTLLFTQRITNGFYINGIAWSHDSTRLAYSNEGVVRVINVTTDQQLFRYDPYQDIAEGVYSMAWSPDETYLAVGASDQEPAPLTCLVRIYSTKTHKTVYTYGGHTDGITAITWSPDGDHIASVDLKHIHVWEALTGGNPYIYTPPGQISDLSWSPDSTRIASVGIGQGVGTGEAIVWQAV